MIGWKSRSAKKSEYGTGQSEAPQTRKAHTAPIQLTLSGSLSFLLSTCKFSTNPPSHPPHASPSSSFFHLRVSLAMCFDLG